MAAMAVARIRFSGRRFLVGHRTDISSSEGNASDSTFEDTLCGALRCREW